MGLFQGLLGRKRKEDERVPQPVPVGPDGQPIDPRLLRMLGSAPQEEPRSKSFGAILKRAQPNLAIARAYLDGDYRTASVLQQDVVAREEKHANAVQLAQQRYRQAQQVAALPGMNEREFAAYLADPDQWRSHMANALSTRHAAANVGQTETRVFGDPTDGGHVYQPPRLVENGVDQLRYDPQTGQSTIAIQGMTDGEQYARSLGYEPGTAKWNRAVQDQQLKGSGPTAYGFDSQLEGQRQQGRMQVRSTPTYRDLNPPAPRSAAPRPQTSGGKVVNVRTPAQAQKLKPGTLYRTPDGVVRRR